MPVKLSNRSGSSMTQLLLVPTVCPDDSTDVVTSMGGLTEGPKVDPKSRNAQKPVLTILGQAVLGLETRSSSVTILRSLILIFVAEQSQSPEWFTDAQWVRTIRGFRDVYKRILLNSIELEQSYVKYFLDKYFARAMFDENPFPINSTFERQPLFSGYLRRIIDRKLNNRSLSFMYSLQKGAKQSWPELPVALKCRALQDHANQICCEKVPPTEAALETVRACSKEVFSRLNPYTLTRFCPTGHACFQFKRSAGGTAACVTDLNEAEAFKTLLMNPKSEDELNAEMTMVSRRIAGEKHGNYGILGSLRAQSLSLAAWRTKEHSYCGQIARENLQLGKGLDVKVMILPEPGKFRILSKGDGYLYNYLQPLQGGMLSAWKKTAFSTMMDDDLTAKIQRLETVSPFKKWVSGDYKGATDTLTRMISLTSCAGLPAGLREIALTSLQAGGKIIYPPVKIKNKEKVGKEDDESIEDEIVIQEGFVRIQKEGQLMGHPLSFPLLCTINLAVYRLALKKWADESWECDVPGYVNRMDVLMAVWDQVIINGDDIAFKADDDLYRCFIEAAKEVGFVLSAGKNYFSPCQVQINSQLFRIQNKVVRRIGYINQKMVYGTSLKGGGESKATPVDLGPEIAKMVKYCPKAACTIPMAMGRFEHRYGNLYPNWYMPTHLGGYGLGIENSPLGEKFTRPQRIYAAMCINDTKHKLYKKKGMQNKTNWGSLNNVVKSVKMMVAPYVPQEFETDIQDEWNERKMYMERCGIMGYDLSDERINARSYVKLESRLQPISIDRLREYYNPRWITTDRGVPCPPLNPLYMRAIDAPENVQAPSVPTMGKIEEEKCSSGQALTVPGKE